MSRRIPLAAIVASLALAIVAVPAASAGTSNPASPQRTTVSPLYTIPMSGVAKNGKKFTGHFGIYRFVVKDGKVWAKGTMSGWLKGRHVTRGNVMFPVKDLTGQDASQARAAANCTVLHLVLAPINLNLLGLRVTLGGGPQANQPIVLDITAQSGQGLLGDLLCSLTNLLNQGGGGGGLLGQFTGQLQQLAATLNGLLSLLGGL